MSGQRQQRQQRMGQAQKSLALGLAAVLGLASPAGFAAPAFRELSDFELSQLRGRYAPPKSEKAIYFGVSMGSRWTEPSGTTYEARVNMEIDTAGPELVSQLYVYESVSRGGDAREATEAGPQATTAQNSTSNSHSGKRGGLDSATGMVQSNQVER